jgi:hypothetical protein
MKPERARSHTSTSQTFRRTRQPRSIGGLLAQKSSNTKENSVLAFDPRPGCNPNTGYTLLGLIVKRVSENVAARVYDEKRLGAAWNDRKSLKDKLFRMSLTNFDTEDDTHYRQLRTQRGTDSLLVSPEGLAVFAEQSIPLYINRVIGHSVKPASFAEKGTWSSVCTYATPCFYLSAWPT